MLNRKWVLLAGTTLSAALMLSACSTDSIASLFDGDDSSATIAEQRPDAYNVEEDLAQQEARPRSVMAGLNRAEIEGEIAAAEYPDLGYIPDRPQSSMTSEERTALRQELSGQGTAAQSRRQEMEQSASGNLPGPMHEEDSKWLERVLGQAAPAEGPAVEEQPSMAASTKPVETYRYANPDRAVEIEEQKMAAAQPSSGAKKVYVAPVVPAPEMKMASAEAFVPLSQPQAQPKSQPKSMSAASAPVEEKAYDPRDWQKPERPRSVTSAPAPAPSVMSEPTPAPAPQPVASSAPMRLQPMSDGQPARASTAPQPVAQPAPRPVQSQPPMQQAAPQPMPPAPAMPQAMPQTMAQPMPAYQPAPAPAPTDVYSQKLAESFASVNTRPVGLGVLEWQYQPQGPSDDVAAGRFVGGNVHTGQASFAPGAPEMQAEPALGQVAGLYFFSNSAQLSQQDRVTLRNVANLYQKQHRGTVQVTGITEGNSTSHRDIAWKRAEAVRDVLAEFAIPTSRIRINTTQGDPNSPDHNRVDVFFTQ